MSELPLLSELPQEGKLPLSSELLPVAVRVILESSTLETSTWEPSVPTCQWEPSVLTWNPGQYQLGNLKNQLGLICFTNLIMFRTSLGNFGTILVNYCTNLIINLVNYCTNLIINLVNYCTSLIINLVPT